MHSPEPGQHKTVIKPITKEKVANYLELARDIIGLVKDEKPQRASRIVVEVAKMIQREELSNA